MESMSTHIADCIGCIAQMIGTSNSLCDTAGNEVAEVSEHSLEPFRTVSAAICYNLGMVLLI